eukprot:m.31933 g.31933  ORF g.31933 m.31933 type:complete len:1607 (-) comp4940_c0_seq1:166-4986(-)
MAQASPAARVAQPAPDNAETQLKIGDLVWAQIKPSPYWPAIVTLEPTTGDSYHATSKHGEHAHHVEFIDTPCMRAWVGREFIRDFSVAVNPKPLTPQLRHAIARAQSLVGMSRDDRLSTISFPYCGAYTQHYIGPPIAAANPGDVVFANLRGVWTPGLFEARLSPTTARVAFLDESKAVRTIETADICEFDPSNIDQPQPAGGTAAQRAGVVAAIEILHARGITGRQAMEVDEPAESPTAKRRKRVDEDDDEEREGAAPEENGGDGSSSSEEAPDDSDDLCRRCGKDGELLLCDHCPAVYHLRCLQPPLETLPEGDWSCPDCVKHYLCPVCKEPATTTTLNCRRCHRAYHTSCVSTTRKKAWSCPDCTTLGGGADVDLIITERIGKDGPELLVKWKDRSHLHNAWVPQAWLDLIAKHKLRGFRRRMNDGTVPLDYQANPALTELERIVASRKGRDGTDFLVKWAGLYYDGCTWEDESDICELPGFADAHKWFQARMKAAKPKRTVRIKSLYKKIVEQPSYLVGGELHPYQMEGLNWLAYSWANKNNGILADEMGLGKTIQAISLLAWLRQEHGRTPFLIVAPLSTCPNWMRELHTWAPHLNAICYIGPQSARDVIRDTEFVVRNGRNIVDVVVVPWSTLLVEHAFLGKITWDCMIVDEGHRLKDDTSKLAKILGSYRTEHRILLTGTPLQNNLTELVNLFQFLQLDFSHHDTTGEIRPELVAALRKDLQPHMLRRVKADVFKDFPIKSEVLVPVNMSPMQRTYYKALLERNMAIFLGPKQRSALLNLIMQLKKCANHPYLFNGAEPPLATPEETMARLAEASGKLLLVLRMLRRLKEQGHRVLIFSQMTRMLDILEDALTFNGFKYCRLDGSTATADRQRAIDDYNRPGSDVLVFLLSTRAGGLGINLTSADTIIIYDCDWNPHMDMQALSRAHRIGQRNMVMVYKLVTRGSVEERIIQRAKEKMLLDQAFVENIENEMDDTDLSNIVSFGAKRVFEESADTKTLDDQQLEDLLDRAKAVPTAEEEVEKHSEFFSSFKVWKEPEAEAAPAEGAEQGDEEFWKNLVQEKLDAIQREKENELLRPRRARQRAAVSYVVEDEEFSPKKARAEKKAAASMPPPNGSTAGTPQPNGAPPQTGLPPAGVAAQSPMPSRPASAATPAPSGPSPKGATGPAAAVAAAVGSLTAAAIAAASQPYPKAAAATAAPYPMVRPSPAKPIVVVRTDADAERTHAEAKASLEAALAQAQSVLASTSPGGMTPQGMPQMSQAGMMQMQMVPMQYAMMGPNGQMILAPYHLTMPLMYAPQLAPPATPSQASLPPGPRDFHPVPVPRAGPPKPQSAPKLQRWRTDPYFVKVLDPCATSNPTRALRILQSISLNMTDLQLQRIVEPRAGLGMLVWTPDPAADDFHDGLLLLKERVTAMHADSYTLQEYSALPALAPSASSGIVVTLKRLRYVLTRPGEARPQQIMLVHYVDQADDPAASASYQPPPQPVARQCPDASIPDHTCSALCRTHLVYPERAAVDATLAQARAALEAGGPALADAERALAQLEAQLLCRHAGTAVARPQALQHGTWPSVFAARRAEVADMLARMYPGWSRDARDKKMKS